MEEDAYILDAFKGSGWQELCPWHTVFHSLEMIAVLVLRDNVGVFIIILSNLNSLQDLLTHEIWSPPSTCYLQKLFHPKFPCPSGLHFLKEADEGRGADYIMLLEDGPGPKRIWPWRKKQEAKGLHPRGTEG